MSEFVKINFPDILKYHNLSASAKKEDKTSVIVFNKKAEEDTSIYEYDYECLRRKERSSLEHKKE